MPNGRRGNLCWGSLWCQLTTSSTKAYGYIPRANINATRQVASVHHQYGATFRCCERVPGLCYNEEVCMYVLYINSKPKSFPDHTIIYIQRNTQRNYLTVTGKVGSFLFGQKSPNQKGLFWVLLVLFFFGRNTESFFFFFFFFFFLFVLHR